MKTKCDHVVAFRFGHEESDYTGEIILESETQLPKSNYRHKHILKKGDEFDDYECAHCPRCGAALNSSGKGE